MLGKYSGSSCRNAKKKRILHKKECITTKIVDCGLWLTAADVHDLESLKFETKKRAALKSQIRFRTETIK